METIFILPQWSRNLPDVSGRFSLMFSRRLRLYQTFCLAGVKYIWNVWQGKQGPLIFAIIQLEKMSDRGSKCPGRVLKACWTFVRHARNHFRKSSLPLPQFRKWHIHLILYIWNGNEGPTCNRGRCVGPRSSRTHRRRCRARSTPSLSSRRRGPCYFTVFIPATCTASTGPILGRRGKNLMQLHIHTFCFFYTLITE